MEPATQTYPTPLFDPGPVLASLDAGKVVAVIAWFMFVLWVVYTVVAAYHWLRYSHRSSIAIPALITHVVVSLALALFAVSGFAPA